MWRGAGAPTAFAIVAAIVSARSAAAEEPTGRVAVVVGAEPIPSAWSAELAAALVDRGVAVAGFRAAVGEPIAPLLPDEAKSLEAELDRGYQRWIVGDPPGAIAILSPACRRWDDRAALSGARLARAYYRGLVALALAHDRQGDPVRAAEAMDDLVRRNPDGTLDRQSYGPRAATLFSEAVSRNAGSSERYDLVVSAPGAAAIYIDGIAAGNERASRRLPPGLHRVAVLDQTGRGRSRVIDFKGPVELVVDVGVDAAIIELDPWLRVRDRNVLGRLATVLGTAQVIALEHRDHRIEARIYQGEREVGRASRPRSKPGNARDLVDELWAVESAARGPWPYAVLGAGTATAVAGVVLVALDGRARCEEAVASCPEVYETAGAGWVLVGIGVATAAFGTAWALWPSSSDRGVAISPHPTVPGVIVHGRF